MVFLETDKGCVKVEMVDYNDSIGTVEQKFIYSMSCRKKSLVENISRLLWVELMLRLYFPQDRRSSKWHFFLTFIL